MLLAKQVSRILYKSLSSIVPFAYFCLVISHSSKLYESWKQQIKTMVDSFPCLKMIKLTIKTGVLRPDLVDIWQPLTTLKNLQELWIHSSSRIDIVSVLSVIGSQLFDVNLMFSNQKVPNGESLDLSSIGKLNF